MNKKPATVKFSPCKECGERFAKKPKDRVFCSDKCRFQYWNKRRMDFRGTNQKIDQLNRKLDIIIERLARLDDYEPRPMLLVGHDPRLEKAAGIKEGL